MQVSAEDPADETAAPEGDEPEEPVTGGAPSSDDDRIQYQDTVDLTPLPGFDDIPAPTADPESDAPEKPAKKPSRAKSKRASMPSWDEIVFGSKHD